MKNNIPRGIRNHNPGNIRLAKFKWVGQVEDHLQVGEASFCRFEHAIFGLRGIGKVLLVYHHYREASDGSVIDTVEEVIDRWAPPSENNTEAYAQHVRDLLDVEKGETIDIDDRATLITLMKSIVQHENGSQPYPDRWFELAAELATLT